MSVDHTTRWNLLTTRGVAIASALCAVCALSSSALAESPRSMMLEVHVGQHTPAIDESTPGTPYADTFGNDAMWLIGMNLDYQVWRDHGSLAVGGGLGYGWVDGFALNGDGSQSADEAGFNILPLSVNVTYRWDWAALRHNVPLVPYAKVGLTWALWWATDGKGDVAVVADEDGNARTGRGGTLGWQAGVGLQFLLDAVSPGMAREFDNDVGVNNSYIFAEFLYRGLDDFGSDSSLDLSAGSLSFGLMFEF